MSDFSNSQLSTPTNELEDIGLFEFLDFDQRLIFVIDISNPENRDYLSIVRSNRAFQERRLLRIISSAPDEFKLWVLGLEAHEDTSRRRFHDIQWTSYTLRGRWKFICGDADLSPMPESAVCSGSPLRPRYDFIFILCLYSIISGIAPWISLVCCSTRADFFVFKEVLSFDRVTLLKCH